MEAGHVGAGKSCDMVRYFEGEDIFGVFTKSRHVPRLKKKGSGIGIKLIKEISRGEYIQGKGQERKNPYLNHGNQYAMGPA